MSAEKNTNAQPELSTELNKERRTWMIATSIMGGVGGTALVLPLVNTFAPSEKAKAAGAAVEMDISGMQPGELRTVEWRGKPVWIVRRTPEQLTNLAKNNTNLADPNSERTPDALTPAYARNEGRSIKPEYFIGVGICSHLGCSPISKFEMGAQPSLPNDWVGGFLCPCHGSTFDMAGRVFKNKPALLLTVVSESNKSCPSLLY
jgi:ubiquinol-cytochrome c reductase iron-sulfur subunit